MELTREKKINEQMLFDNAPVESDDYETEAQILDAQVKKQCVTNIGVVATYGAGKSSAINTYLKRYRKKGIRQPKHVQISLADFNKDEVDANNENNNYSENAIERSILQQLFYSQKRYKLPKSSIFVKLRELNTIINNSPRKANKVTFIYAVKDSMFKDENQRAKFFEFILPIIPVMNPVTTFDNIDKMHKQLVFLDSSLKLSEQFLKDISFYVSDMRVLKNTFNDYVIMANKLSENSDNKLVLKRENLFALALYKTCIPMTIQGYRRMRD